MKSIREFFRNLGIDGWIFGIAGLVAIFFGVFGLLGIWPFDEKVSLQIIIGAIGALLLAVVSQTSRRQDEIQEIKDAIGVGETQVLNSSEEYGHHLIPKITSAKKFIWDMSLIRAAIHLDFPTHIGGPQADYRRILFERVSKGEIIFKRVEVVFHKQNLETLVRKLLLHEGFKYYMRHYEPSSMHMPILHIHSFDDEHFYLGGFHIKETPRAEQTLYVREPKLASLLSDYWSLLWDNAIPLNEGGIIDWDELRHIGIRVGLSDIDFNAMVEKVRIEVQKEKRQLFRR